MEGNQNQTNVTLEINEVKILNALISVEVARIRNKEGHSKILNALQSINTKLGY